MFPVLLINQREKSGRQRQPLKSQTEKKMNKMLDRFWFSQQSSKHSNHCHHHPPNDQANSKSFPLFLLITWINKTYNLLACALTFVCPHFYNVEGRKDTTFYFAFLGLSPAARHLITDDVWVARQSCSSPLVIYTLKGDSFEELPGRRTIRLPLPLVNEEWELFANPLS